MADSRVALVTGAGSGMGRAVTEQLVQKGWKVAICDVNDAPGEAVAKSLGEAVFFLKADVSQYDQLARVFEAAWSKWGRLDFVAANAGIGETDSFYDFGGRQSGNKGPPRPNLKTVDVDLMGALYTVYLANYYLQKAPGRGGCINVTASGIAFFAYSALPLYSASKTALPGLVRAMAPELQKHKVRINCLCPGLVDTGLSHAVIDIFPAEHCVSMDIIMQVHQRFIEGDETGSVADISTSGVHLRKEPEYVDGSQRWMVENMPRVLEEYMLTAQAGPATLGKMG